MWPLSRWEKWILLLKNIYTELSVNVFPIPEELNKLNARTSDVDGLLLICSSDKIFLRNFVHSDWSEETDKYMWNIWPQFWEMVF